MRAPGEERSKSISASVSSGRQITLCGAASWWQITSVPGGGGPNERHTAPGGGPEAVLRVVEPAQHRGDGDEGLVGHPVRLQRIGAALAVQVGENLTAALVDAERPRRAGEADPLEVVQQRVHRGRPRTGVAPDRVTDPDHRARVPADERDLLLHHPDGTLPAQRDRP